MKSTNSPPSTLHSSLTLNTFLKHLKTHLYRLLLIAPSDLSSASDSFYWMITALNQIYVYNVTLDNVWHLYNVNTPASVTRQRTRPVVNTITTSNECYHPHNTYVKLRLNNCRKNRGRPTELRGGNVKVIFFLSMLWRRWFRFKNTLHKISPRQLPLRFILSSPIKLQWVRSVIFFPCVFLCMSNWHMDWVTAVSYTHLTLPTILRV